MVTSSPCAFVTNSFNCASLHLTFNQHNGNCAVSFSCVLQCTCLIRKTQSMRTRLRFDRVWNTRLGQPVHSG